MFISPTAFWIFIALFIGKLVTEVRMKRRRQMMVMSDNDACSDDCILVINRIIRVIV